MDTKKEGRKGLITTKKEIRKDKCKAGRKEIKKIGMGSERGFSSYLKHNLNTFRSTTFPPTGMTTDSGVGGSVGGNLTSLAITQRLFTQAAHDFVARSLARYPEERPSADDLLNHPFIRQTRKFNHTLPQYLHPVVPLNQQTEIGECRKRWMRDG